MIPAVVTERAERGGGGVGRVPFEEEEENLLSILFFLPSYLSRFFCCLLP